MNAYETVGLGSVCELVMGQSPSSDTYNSDGIGLPFFQGNADFGEEHPTPSTWCSEPKKTARKGDILISVRAPIGAVNTATEECCIGRGVAAIRPDGGLLNAAFLKYHLIAKRPELERAGTGSTFTAIGKKALSELEVRLYGLDDQFEMSRRLDVLSENIRTAREQLTMLDYLVKSRFIEMFESRDMPRKKLSEVVWFQEGPGVRKHQYTEAGVKLLNVANLHDGILDTTNTDRYISREEACGRYSHFLVDEGDLIIASSGIKVEYFDKKMGFVRAEQLPLCMNTSTIRFKSLDEDALNIVFFQHFLKSDDFKRQLMRQITGSAQLNFGPSHLKRMSVPIPKQDLQEQFADFATQVDKLRFDDLSRRFSSSLTTQYKA